MNDTLQIRFQGMAPSPALSGEIQRRAEALEAEHPGMTGCQVLVVLAHPYVQHAKHFDITVSWRGPQGLMLTHHASSSQRATEAAFGAVGGAFEKLKRQLDGPGRGASGAPPTIPRPWAVSHHRDDSAAQTIPVTLRQRRTGRQARGGAGGTD